MSDCPFCDYDGPSEVLEKHTGAYIIRPIEPVQDGHVLVVPWTHVDDFKENAFITGEAAAAAARYAQRRLWPHWNLITSAGEAATQTVKHLHFHLVPRWKGDGLKLPWTEPDEAGETTSRASRISGADRAVLKTTYLGGE